MPETFHARVAARDFGSRPKICRPAADTGAISPQTRKRPLVSRLDTAVLCTEFKCQPSRGTESLPPDSQNPHEVSKNTYTPYSLGTGSCALFKLNKFSAQLYFLNHEGAFAFFLFPSISLRSRGKVWTENGRRFLNLTQKFWKPQNLSAKLNELFINTLFKPSEL